MTQKDRERAEAIDALRGFYPVGSTVYTILRHVSRSGMQRTIGVLASMGDGDFRHPNYSTSKALGMPLDPQRDGVKVGGCGMDMGFHVAYSLSHALYPDGFGCIGEGCPSNDHSNGDRDYTPHAEQYTADTCPGRPCGTDCDHKSQDGRPHWHNDGGYALRHRWL